MCVFGEQDVRRTLVVLLLQIKECDWLNRHTHPQTQTDRQAVHMLLLMILLLEIHSLSLGQNCELYVCLHQPLTFLLLSLQVTDVICSF